MNKEFNDSIEGLSIEEYVYGFVNFCLTFDIEITNKNLEQLIDSYVRRKLELDDIIE